MRAEPAFQNSFLIAEAQDGSKIIILMQCLLMYDLSSVELLPLLLEGTFYIIAN